MKKHTAKRHGLGLGFKAFVGKSGKSYIVFRTPRGGYHVFAEIDAKESAIDCGAPAKGNTRAQWKAVWDAYQLTRVRPAKIPNAELPLKSSKNGVARLRARIAASKS